MTVEHPKQLRVVWYDESIVGHLAVCILDHWAVVRTRWLCISVFASHRLIAEWFWKLFGAAAGVIEANGIAHVARSVDMMLLDQFEELRLLDRVRYGSTNHSVYVFGGLRSVLITECHE